jgi:hypothetical protein
MKKISLPDLVTSSLVKAAMVRADAMQMIILRPYREDLAQSSPKMEPRVWGKGRSKL